MSLTRPTLLDVAGALSGVAGSPADISTVGTMGELDGSFANCMEPFIEHASALPVIGVKPSSRAIGCAACALPINRSVLIATPLIAVTIARVRTRKR